MLHRLALFALTFLLRLGILSALTLSLGHITAFAADPSSMLKEFEEISAKINSNNLCRWGIRAIQRADDNVSNLIRNEKTQIPYHEGDKKGWYEGIPQANVTRVKRELQPFIDDIKEVDTKTFPEKERKIVEDLRYYILELYSLLFYSSLEGMRQCNEKLESYPKHVQAIENALKDLEEERTRLGQEEDKLLARMKAGGGDPGPTSTPDPKSSDTRVWVFTKTADDQARIICGYPLPDDEGIIRRPPPPPFPPSRPGVVVNYKLIIERLITQLDEVKMPTTKKEAPAALAKFKAIDSSASPLDFR